MTVLLLQVRSKLQIVHPRKYPEVIFHQFCCNYFHLSRTPFIYPVHLSSIPYTYRLSCTVRNFIYPVHLSAVMYCTSFHLSRAPIGCHILQDLLGPRFCLPASLFPRAYDYYRQVPSHVLRGSHSPSLAGNTNAGSTSTGDVENGGLIECVICYNAVETDTGNYMVSINTSTSHRSFLLSTDIILSIIISIVDHTLRSFIPQTLFAAVAHHEDGVLHMQSSATSYRGFLIRGRS